MSTQILVTVSAPHYTASLVTRDGVCSEAAPILRWAIGKRWSYLESYFKRKGFGFSLQPDPAQHVGETATQDARKEDDSLKV